MRIRRCTLSEFLWDLEHFTVQFLWNTKWFIKRFLSNNGLKRVITDHDYALFLMQKALTLNATTLVFTLLKANDSTLVEHEIDGQLIIDEESSYLSSRLFYNMWDEYRKMANIYENFRITRGELELFGYYNCRCNIKFTQKPLSIILEFHPLSSRLDDKAIPKVRTDKTHQP